MDLLLQHEGFLRVIFDAPNEYTNRLVYADFLEENDLALRAEIIRVQCELVRMLEDADPARRKELEERNDVLQYAVVPWAELPTSTSSFNRGLWHSSGAAREGVGVTVSHLEDPVKFREFVVRVSPAWYGETSLYPRYGEKLGPAHVETLFALPFTQQVRDWNLAGWVDEEPTGEDTGDPTFALTDIVQRPVITSSGVEALAKNRGARRIVTLDLRNNNLDNDAAQALVVSPYFERLKKLSLFEGNRFRGRLWQRVIARFGEEVVE